MWVGGHGHRLQGRRAEREALDHVIAEAHAGRSQVLVIRGAPGIGKTALLDDLVERVAGCRVIRAAGVESEMELAFAGLHQLCAPMLDQLDRLPGPQRDALATAFGLSAGEPPDRFLVGLAVLSLLSDAAIEQTLLCIVDDGQWLDQVSAQALAFVARRLLAERVALLIAVRDAGGPKLPGLPELRVEGLREVDARRLLNTAVPGPLDERIRDRIVAETRGNPLALLELPRGFTAAELAGGFALPDTLPLTSRIERSFTARLETLPAATRRLLFAAAAEPIGDVSLLLRAAERLGVGASAAAPAEQAGLIELGAQVRFRHPLVRSAIYQAASPEQRRDAHQVLADVTDSASDPDHRAWHRAMAAHRPDEALAAELERSADRAQMRGGVAAAAAFLDRAADLTPDPGRRGARRLAAARAKLQAGSAAAAAALLAAAESGPLTGLERAQATLLQGQLAFTSSHGRDAPPLLVRAARQFQTLDPARARETYLDALAAALFVGRFGGEASVRDVAVAAAAATATGDPPNGAPELLLAALSETITNGYTAGAAGLQHAVAAFRAESVPSSQVIRWFWLATHAAHDVWDDEGWEALADTHIRMAREAGALHVLPLALSARTGLHLFQGQLTLASSLVQEVSAVTAATGNRLPPYGPLELAAYRGDEAEAVSLIDAALDEVQARGEGMGWTLVRHAEAVLYNGLGEYERAYEAAHQGAGHPAELGFAQWSLVQLVEAAVRSERPGEAVDAVDRLSNVTRACGTEWARGVEARCRALVSEGDDAEQSYRDAIDHLGRTRLHLELARARLLYGEWLRREKRRADARVQLTVAYEMFNQAGVDGFAERARRELRSAGTAVRARAVALHESLTPQELQIAQLARDGLTNVEIGARLFISRHTVEWHLRHVFSKLGVTSRQQLRGRLLDGASKSEPA